MIHCNCGSCNEAAFSDLFHL